MIDQLDDQPVFKVQPITAIADADIRVLHRNMLFTLKRCAKSGFEEPEDAQNIALMKANMLMDIYFQI